MKKEIERLNAAVLKAMAERAPEPEFITVMVEVVDKDPGVPISASHEDAPEVHRVFRASISSVDEADG